MTSPQWTQQDPAPNSSSVRCIAAVTTARPGNAARPCNARKAAPERIKAAEAASTCGEEDEGGGTVKEAAADGCEEQGAGANTGTGCGKQGAGAVGVDVLVDGCESREAAAV